MIKIKTSDEIGASILKALGIPIKNLLNKAVITIEATKEISVECTYFVDKEFDDVEIKKFKVVAEND